MRSPTLPPGSRFFARVDRFHCECPNCGIILLATGGPVGRRVSKAPTKIRGNPVTAYNPLSSTLRCHRCGRTYQVGLILWPVGTGPWGKDKRIPADQKPTRDQLRQLRQYATGWFATAVKAKGAETNVAVTADCLCPLGGWKPACPVHGWDETTGTFRTETTEEEG